MTNKNLRTCDLFAGIGGVRLAFENAGFSTVFANDFDESCGITYNLNFEEPKLLVGDVRDINSKDIPDFDVLLAGFPCQPFSIAGYRKGFDDERGNMFFEVIRVLEAKKPKALLLENVKNLKTHDNGRTVEIIKEKLNRLGYKIKIEVLNTMNHGNIPHNRERIFIAGFLDENSWKHFSFPNEVALEKTLADFIDQRAEEKYYYKGKYLYNKIKDSIKSKNTAYQWRRKYVRENKKGVCPTLTANMGTGGHNVPIVMDMKGIRKLTPRECLRLQGFPDTFNLPDITDSKLYKQAGNSVSVPVIERIAINMKNALLTKMPVIADAI